MTKSRKPVEAVSGRYTALPHEVMDSVAFRNAGHTARSLLFELLRQHNGGNNGRLQLAGPWLKRRGWTSSDVIQRAKRELLERELVIQTRQGGLNFGPSWFAVTWLPISNFVGLDLTANQYHPGAWRFLDASPIAQKQSTHPVKRNSTAPSSGVGVVQAAPLEGTKTVIFEDSTTPPNGNNECYQLPPANPVCRIVGVAGKSGKRLAIA